jgi:hypothetical protein
MLSPGSNFGAPAKVLLLADYRGGRGSDDPPRPPPLGARKARGDTLLAEAVVADGADRSGFAGWRQCA